MMARLERVAFDYVAFTPDGFAYALCSADQREADLADFKNENASSEIRLMPGKEACDAHRKWLDELARRQGRRP